MRLTIRLMAGYALGLHVRDYRGRTLLQHTGGLPGYLSKVAMMPELRLGVAVLTNQESGAAFESIVYQVLDHYLGATTPDYPAIYDRLVIMPSDIVTLNEVKGTISGMAPFAALRVTMAGQWRGQQPLRGRAA